MIPVDIYIGVVGNDFARMMEMEPTNYFLDDLVVCVAVDLNCWSLPERHPFWRLYPFIMDGAGNLTLEAAIML